MQSPARTRGTTGASAVASLAQRLRMHACDCPRRRPPPHRLFTNRGPSTSAPPRCSRSCTRRSHHCSRCTCSLPVGLRERNGRGRAQRSGGERGGVRGTVRQLQLPPQARAGILTLICACNILGGGAVIVHRLVEGVRIIALLIAAHSGGKTEGLEGLEPLVHLHPGTGSGGGGVRWQWGQPRQRRGRLGRGRHQVLLCPGRWGRQQAHRQQQQAGGPGESRHGVGGCLQCQGGGGAQGGVAGCIRPEGPRTADGGGGPTRVVDASGAALPCLPAPSCVLLAPALPIGVAGPIGERAQRGGGP